MKSPSEAPVTGLSPRAYGAIFGCEEIIPDETIIDIGSGESALGSIVPEGEMIQVDPTYGTAADREDNVSFVSLTLGEPDVFKNPDFRALVATEPTRVTTAHMLHHLSGEQKLRAVEQILHLGRHGITQFYPAFSRESSELINRADRRGVDITITRPPIRNLGQLFFSLTRINHTLTVVNQPKRMSSGDRIRLAELILPAIV